MVNLYEVLWHLLCQNLATLAKIMVIKVKYVLMRIVNFSIYYVLSSKHISMIILYFNIHK